MVNVSSHLILKKKMQKKNLIFQFLQRLMTLNLDSQEYHT